MTDLKKDMDKMFDKLMSGFDDLIKNLDEKIEKEEPKKANPEPTEQEKQDIGQKIANKADELGEKMKMAILPIILKESDQAAIYTALCHIAIQYGCTLGVSKEMQLEGMPLFIESSYQAMDNNKGKIEKLRSALKDLFGVKE